MLEISERCRLDVRKDIQVKLDEIGDKIWNVPEIEALLKTWVHSVSARGKCNKELSPPSDLSSDPDCI